ncbi:unnamed protein product [Arctogadus glacialis]
MIGRVFFKGLMYNADHTAHAHSENTHRPQTHTAHTHTVDTLTEHTHTLNAYTEYIRPHTHRTCKQTTLTLNTHRPNKQPIYIYIYNLKKTSGIISYICARVITFKKCCEPIGNGLYFGFHCYFCSPFGSEAALKKSETELIIMSVCILFVFCYYIIAYYHKGWMFLPYYNGVFLDSKLPPNRTFDYVSPSSVIFVEPQGILKRLQKILSHYK